jgi:hypothetical protein
MKLPLAALQTGRSGDSVPMLTAGTADLIAGAFGHNPETDVTAKGALLCLESFPIKSWILMQLLSKGEKVC